MAGPVFDNLRVVLVAPRNPLNIGAAARAMSNFGFFHLRVASSYDMAFREARSAVGAAGVLAHAEQLSTVPQAVADCALVVGATAGGRRELHHPLRRLKEGTRLIRKRLRSSRVALLFGSEKTGLTNEALSHCHWLMRIPTRKEHRAMNLGQAVAVCLYELARDSRVAAQQEKQNPATAGMVQSLDEVLLEALRRSGYVNPRAAEATAQKIRRLVRRLCLSASDAEVFLGMLRQVLWKLRDAKEHG